MMDVPTAEIPGGSLHNLGENEIEKNILINCVAQSNPDTYQYYSSPNDNGYKDVTSPYTGGTGNIFLTEADFYDYANLIPLAGGAADLGEVGDEIYMGAIPPIPEPATLISLSLLGLGASLLRRKKGTRELEKVVIN